MAGRRAPRLREWFGSSYSLGGSLDRGRDAPLSTRDRAIWRAVIVATALLAIAAIVWVYISER